MTAEKERLEMVSNTRQRRVNAVKMFACGFLVLLAACSKPADAARNFPALPTFPATATIPSQATIVPAMDVCRLLSEAEVEPVLGQPIINVQSQSKLNTAIGTTNNCLYSSVSTAIIIDVGQSRTARGSDQWKQLQSDFAASVISDGVTSPAAGLGDWAVWTEREKAGGYVFTRYPYILSVIIGGGEVTTPASYQAGLKKLAVLVISRLPH